MTRSPATNSLSGFGIQTSAISAGGDTPTVRTNASESWNGTSWTSTPSLNTARYSLSGAGASNTAGLVFGGSDNNVPTDPVQSASESWNGTSWTSTPSLNTARRGLAGAGIQTSALTFGGSPGSGVIGSTELWNGTSWTTNPNSMGTSRVGMAGFGTQSSALAAGGYTTTWVGTTEEWTGQAFQTKTITVS
jgi:hypothetical protein